MIQPATTPDGFNPFSTRFVRPGALPYVFAAGENEAKVIDRLGILGWRAQIIGPHGSGKSTLVAQLLGPLARAGHPAWLFTLRDGQRRLPADWQGQVQSARAALVFVDGYEQLSFASRWLIKFACRRQGWGLLVTAHRPVGFPTLMRTSSSLALAEAVVGQLLRGRDAWIDRQAISECFTASGSNLREMLFALYDRYEAQRTHGD
ncbi:MAG TPA: hypothetical protein VHV08_00910 [Pirellulales bacterium]|nr:hypothetical protein [Pirellulales bacterium]